MANAKDDTWEYKALVSRHAVGWTSQPAITRVKQAVREMKKVAKCSTG